MIAVPRWMMRRYDNEIRHQDAARRREALAAAQQEEEAARAALAEAAEQIAAAIETGIAENPGRCHCAFILGKCGWCWRVYQAELDADRARRAGGLG